MKEMPPCYQKRIDRAFIRLGRSVASAMAIAEEVTDKDDVTIDINVHGMFEVSIRRIK